jgi:hypothetical protein
VLRGGMDRSRERVIHDARGGSSGNGEDMNS